MGDIFISCGNECLIFPYFTIVAYPPFSLSFASAIRHLRAIGCLADTCGPRRMAASICAFVQFSPQSTGHPTLL